MKASPNSAWFFCPESCALFVGVSGGKYPNSYELESCTAMTLEEADAVLMRQIVPYQSHLKLTKGITEYFKTVQPEP